MDARRQKNYYRTNYTDGSAARKLSARPQYGERQQQEQYEQRQLNREEMPVTRKAVGRGIDFVSMVFLAAVMTATLYMCIEYLKVQADLSQVDKTIVTLENDLENVQDKNNATEAELDQKIDMDYIYRVAVGEYGMVYPNHNKVIEYKSQEKGYMKQNEDIPEVTANSILDAIFD